MSPRWPAEPGGVSAHDRLNPFANLAEAQQDSCEECGYELAGLGQCSECGRVKSELAAELAMARRRVARRWWIPVGGHLTCLVLAVVLSEVWFGLLAEGSWRESVLLGCAVEVPLLTTTLVAFAYPRFLRASLALRALRAGLFSALVWAVMPVMCFGLHAVGVITGAPGVVSLSGFLPLLAVVGALLTIGSMDRGIDELTVLGPRRVGVFVFLTLVANLMIALNGFALFAAVFAGV